jgi:hypothetical protein
MIGCRCRAQWVVKSCGEEGGEEEEEEEEQQQQQQQQQVVGRRSRFIGEEKTLIKALNGGSLALLPVAASQILLLKDEMASHGGTGVEQGASPRRQPTF